MGLCSRQAPLHPLTTIAVAPQQGLLSAPYRRGGGHWRGEATCQVALLTGMAPFLEQSSALNTWGVAQTQALAKKTTQWSQVGVGAVTAASETDTKTRQGVTARDGEVSCPRQLLPSLLSLHVPLSRRLPAIPPSRSQTASAPVPFGKPGPRLS